MNRIYLDHNSTSIVDDNVAEAMIKQIQEMKSFNSSSIHADGRNARNFLEKARKNIAESLKIDLFKDDVQIIFTSSGTEANNLIIHNFKNSKLFVSAIEHVSILDAAHPDKNIIPVDNKGLIDLNILNNILEQHKGLKLVSIMLANNETGVIQDIKKISEIVHKNGGLLHCDASQGFCKIDIAFNDLGCDFMTISSHKSGGPLGAAALIAKKIVNLEPMIKGGKQEQGIRAGTENLLAITGFGVAAANCAKKISHFKQIEGMRDNMEKEILEYAPNAEIMAKDALRLPNTSCIRMPNVKAEEQLIKFDLAGISVSSGAACSSGRIASSHVLKAMGLSDNSANECVRVSLGLKNNSKELEAFVKLWKEIYKKGNENENANLS